ncbi:MAG: amidohydrolase family protein [Pseudomonadota bacterium]
MTVLIRNARVLTFDAEDRELARADVLIEGSRIVAVGPDLAPPQGPIEVIDASGQLLMPGLVNAHLHSPANLLKGALDDAPLEIFMLYEVPPMGDTPEGGRINYLRTMLGAIEMLKLGVTSVHDDAFFNPTPTQETIDAIMSAYADAGMRATVALDQPTLVEYEKYPFLEALLPEEEKAAMRAAPRQSDAELLALYEDFIARWHGREGGRLRCSTSCSAPQRVGPDYLLALSDLSRRHDLPFNIHILETRLQRVLGQEKFGKSLIRYVDDLGALDERKVVIHSIWIDDEDLAAMARAGCTVAHNPISNMKIGSGVMPFRAIRDAGIPVCIGTDEAAVDDSANLWLAGKQAALLGRLSDPDWDRWPKAPEILDCMIRGGARSMGLSDTIGVVAPGYEADLILLDLSAIAFTPLNDLRRQLVFCETGASVRMTMVAGRVVMRDGRLLTVDEAAIWAEIHEAMAESGKVFERIHAHAERLMPFYRAMTARADATPIGPVLGLPARARTARPTPTASQATIGKEGDSDE